MSLGCLQGPFRQAAYIWQAVGRIEAQACEANNYDSQRQAEQAAACQARPGQEPQACSAAQQQAGRAAHAGQSSGHGQLCQHWLSLLPAGGRDICMHTGLTSCLQTLKLCTAWSLIEAASRLLKNLTYCSTMAPSL